MRITYANYQFWVFVLVGATLAFAHRSRPLTVAPYVLATEVDPDYAIGHFNIGVAEQRAGHLPEALERYRAAAAADPTDHTRCVNHAEVARELDKLDEALEAARCATTTGSPGGPEYDELGQVLLARHDEAGAVEAFETSLRDTPHVATTELDLGAAYARLERVADAERAWRAAVADDPKLAEAWFDLGNLVWKQHNPSEAYTDFTAAVTADPTYVKAMGNLAALDAEAGRTAAALAWTDKLLAIEPNNEKAKAFRATLAP